VIAFLRNPLCTAVVAVLCLPFRAAAADSGPLVGYSVSIASPEKHLVHVRMELPSGKPYRELQLPVWNALYQVRDFSQYLNWVKASTPEGRTLPVRLLDKSRWAMEGADAGVIVEYEIYTDQPGPFSAQLNEHHAFFNLAQILMYATDDRQATTQITFTDVPAGWKIASALKPSSPSSTPQSLSANSFGASSYDELVDSPVEIGEFQESGFDLGGAHYQVVIDADAADYNMDKIVAMLQSITAAATDWMSDRPFDSYLFLYHFPRGPGGGGMEHAYSTAISVSAQTLIDRPETLPDVTAHEFFHLWNVKRIRPQSLGPVDYTQEQYSRALWFSEGCTSTAGAFIELRAGLADEKRFLRELADQIGELEQRPAHLTQSAEDSSLDAWLEKYPYYRQADRSVSYYNKGFLLCIALDLAVRDATQDKASLRELFQQMNQRYAKQHKFFGDSKAVRETAEAVSHADMGQFFESYVSGTEEIPWDEFFKSVGLRLSKNITRVVDAGFSASRNFDGPPLVSAVRFGSDAQAAGLRVGDEVLALDGKTVAAPIDPIIQAMKPGETIKVTVRSGRTERTLQWRLTNREQQDFELKDLGNITPQQKTRRAAWLKGEAEGEARP
jgi:predicted metalloprotease with PDZ domain